MWGAQVSQITNTSHKPLQNAMPTRRYTDERQTASEKAKESKGLNTDQSAMDTSVEQKMVGFTACVGAEIGKQFYGMLS